MKPLAKIYEVVKPFDPDDEPFVVEGWFWLPDPSTLHDKPRGPFVSFDAAKLNAKQKGFAV